MWKTSPKSHGVFATKAAPTYIDLPHSCQFVMKLTLAVASHLSCNWQGHKAIIQHMHYINALEALICINGDVCISTLLLLVITTNL
jgi:hypothetical protein